MGEACGRDRNDRETVGAFVTERHFTGAFEGDERTRVTVWVHVHIRNTDRNTERPGICDTAH